MEPQTQKAKGINLLKTIKLAFNGDIKPLPFHLVSGEDSIYSMAAAWQTLGVEVGEDIFGRPCPPTPEHGFVDSIPVKTPAEAHALFLKAHKANAQSEMILMPYIKAKFNAIWTPGSLTIGPGNDGATSGKDAIKLATVKTVPCSMPGIAALAGIKDGDVPYFEFVMDETNQYVVQLRGGPDISEFGDDYLSAKIKVAHIVEPQGEDLIQWKKRVETFKPGTVVWHVGGALSTHYGVHCKDNHVPYFTVRKPKAGETLDFCKCKPKPKKVEWCPTCGGFTTPLPELDVEETLRGIEIGVNLDVSYRDAALIVLGALHNSAVFGKKESRIFGAAMALAVRLGTIACFGEARHKTNASGHHVSRDQIYDVGWKALEDLIKRFNESRALFYGVQWSAAFGGKKWGACADATAVMWNRMVAFIRSKSDADLTLCKDGLNEIVNQAHNNGWWFNKFIQVAWFDTAVKYGSAPLIVVSKAIYEIMRAEVRGGLIEKIERVEKADRGVDGNKTQPAQQIYKGFSIAFTESEKLPWALVNPQTKEVIKKFLNLRDVAYFLNESYGKSTEKRFVTATYAVLSRAIKQTSTKTVAGGDAWVIPDLDPESIKENVAKAMANTPKPVPPKPIKIDKAQCRLNGIEVHVQMMPENGTPYRKTDVPLKAQEITKFREAYKKALALTSYAGSPTIYKVCEVLSIGVYLGGVKLVALKNFVLQE